MYVCVCQYFGQTVDSSLALWIVSSEPDEALFLSLFHLTGGRYPSLFDLSCIFIVLSLKGLLSLEKTVESDFVHCV